MNKANILIIEDEEDILELARYNLKREGYQVSRLSSGEDAVENVRDKKTGSRAAGSDAARYGWLCNMQINEAG